MPRSSQRPRGYHSPMRQKQADETRQRVVEAARKLFGARGFDGTTIDAIAREAGVATPTVYAAFGSKRGLVAELLDRARFGTGYQELIAQALAASSPADRLGFSARIARQVYDAERAELDLLRGAGAVSPELAALERGHEHERMAAQAALIEQLASARLLRVDAAAAADILWTLTGREIYRMLVVERGWSSDRYQAWLDETLTGALLGPARTPPRSRNRKRLK
jgi:TetR/AcrR family transcriptional regulator, regulator of cefoperazone and chloramphenicol sensitivity